MDTAVPMEIDQLHRSPGHSLDGFLETDAAHGEHRPVMIRVAMDVQDALTTGIGDGSDDVVVTTFADIDDAGESWSSDGAPPDGCHGSVVAGRQSGEPMGPEDASPFTLGRSPPHSMVHPVGQGVLETRGLHGALLADAPGDLNSDPVTREEGRRVQLPASASSHPIGLHRTSDTALRLSVRLLTQAL